MDEALNNATRVIQLALTPIFLLSAIGSLLGVFSTRLGRISDRIHVVTGASGHRIELARLRTRSRLLDAAVVAAASAGGLTCCSAIVLFIDSIRGGFKATLLFSIFGAALGFAMLSLGLYVAEILVAGRAIRETE